MIELQKFGWSDREDESWVEFSETGYVPGRVVADFGKVCTVAIPEKHTAQISGSLTRSISPKIGDWVAVDMSGDQAVVRAVLTRRNELARGQVGRSSERQVVAANVDMALIIQPLNHDFSVARLERYLFQLSSQLITPVIVLNKTDTVDSIEPYLDALSEVDAMVVSISALRSENVSEIENIITPGQTIVIVGSSGAGKSTIVNRLLGEARQTTQEVRSRDSKGRHTTVHRELFILPGGGIVIDTPGVRELQLWGSVSDLDQTFTDIVDAARKCHYPNCSHLVEEGCAVRLEIESGSISSGRFRLYQGFKQELEELEERVLSARPSKPYVSAKKVRSQGKNIRDRDDYYY